MVPFAILLQNSKYISQSLRPGRETGRPASRSGGQPEGLEAGQRVWVQPESTARGSGRPGRGSGGQPEGLVGHPEGLEASQSVLSEGLGGQAEGLEASQMV